MSLIKPRSQAFFATTVAIKYYLTKASVCGERFTQAEEGIHRKAVKIRGKIHLLAEMSFICIQLTVAVIKLRGRLSSLPVFVCFECVIQIITVYVCCKCVYLLSGRYEIGGN